MKRLYLFACALPLVWLCSCAAKKVSPSPNVSTRVISYPSVDQFGEPILLSGKVSIPTDKTPKGILLSVHGTVTGNQEVPSAKMMHDEPYFNGDYLMVMPDYMGYGITKDSIHPYLCGELTAQHCIDMLLYVRQMADSMEWTLQTDSITIFGYSQGGATAVWTLKVLEERYSDRLPVKACYAGSGPYDVVSEYDASVQKNRANIPMTIPMLLMGTKTGYQLDLRPEDYFTRHTQKVYTKYLESKKYGIFDVWLATQNYKLSHWLKKEAMDRSHPTTQQIREGLLRSCVVHYPLDSTWTESSICPSWRPRAKTYVFHSTNDDGVGFFNSEHLRRCWGEAPNVTYDFGKYGGHIKAFYLFIERVAELEKR